MKAFAGWIYETFGLESFIDSCSWGYCDELLRRIDDKYCYNKKSKTYNYKLRNYTTSHVHMMLSTALAEMIDKTECVIFFNTPNSINMEDEINNIKDSKKTLSPWIYYELSMINLIKETSPIRTKPFFEHSSFNQRNDININYDVSKLLKELKEIKDNDLLSWQQIWCNHPINNKKYKAEALDTLYEIIFPKK